MEDLSIPTELLAEADNMFSTGFNLTVPEKAELSRNKGYTRWTEVVQIDAAYREEKVTEAGNTHMVYALKTKVLPAGDTVNGGKTYMVWHRINYKAADEGNHEDGQFKMSAGSTRRLKAFFLSFGVTLTKENSNELLTGSFPFKEAEAVSPLIGKKFQVGMLDNDDPQKRWPKVTGENQQDIEAYTAVSDE